MNWDYHCFFKGNGCASMKDDNSFAHMDSSYLLGIYLSFFLNSPGTEDVSNKTGSVFMLNQQGILRIIEIILINRSLCN